MALEGGDGEIPFADETGGQRHADQPEAAEHKTEGGQRHAPADALKILEPGGADDEEHAADRKEEAGLDDRVVEDMDKRRREARLARQRNAEHEIAELRHTR